MKPLISKSFDFKLFIYVFLGFIAFTVIGTLSHEGGHYLAARYYGNEAAIYYQSCGITKANDIRKQERALFVKYRDSIVNNHSFPERDKYLELEQKLNAERRVFGMAGPIQTLLTGTLGLLFLIFTKKKYFATEELRPIMLIPILTALFWLRPLANLAGGLLLYIRTGCRGYSDEIGLAQDFNLAPQTIELAIGGIAAIVFAYVVFVIIPLKSRLTFLIGGLLGGVAGYYLWLIKFGPIILPHAR